MTTTASTAPVPPTAGPTPPLAVSGATLGYDGRTISDRLDVEIPDGSFTVIVGPNACGKSTLLRGLARLLKPSTGQVLLDGRDIHGLRTKEVARRLGLLPQTSLAPDGITVADLVARGRHPHQSAFRTWSRADEAAVAAALAATGIAELSGRRVDELSGGQRQRVWVALALAQETGILLLDEPTTFLDIAHQFELLELFRTLNREGRTLVAVLHDLNQASRYATHIIAMNEGRIVAEGVPADVVTAELVHEVFGLPAHVLPDPISGTPLVVPLGAPGSVFAVAPPTPPPSSLSPTPARTTDRTKDT
ncbi:ABC transporter ATP-binding protein [Leifsonia aquatica]|uniref:ABC transporter ATP-binding protein n=1 Tax=Leifsonia aquatica TaxID=144185 RepID=UPI000468A2B9|nr:ABC transporter ATP-binding protein [Leifsonia aquatica]